MADLSTSKAWTDGSRFAAREFRLLFPIAFLLLALPGVVLNLLIPQQDSPEMYDLVASVQQNGVAALILASLAVGLVLMIFQALASLAIAYLTLRPGRSVGEGLRAAFRRLPALLGAMLVLGLVGAAILFALVVPFALSTSGGAAGPSDPPSGLFLLVLCVIILLSIALWTRLILMTPVGAVEPLGPIGIIARSWRLTAGHFWPLFGALIMLGIVIGILAMLVSMFLGLIVLATIGNPLQVPTAMFVHYLLNSVFTSAAAVFTIAFFARIYAQLADEPDPAATTY